MRDSPDFKGGIRDFKVKLGRDSRLTNAQITTEITGLRENLGTLEEGRGFNPEAGPLLRVLK